LLEYHFPCRHVNVFLLEVLPQLVEGDIVLIMADVLEGLEQLLLLGLAVLLLYDKAVEQVFLGEFGLGGSGVDGLLDDADLAIAHGDGDEVEEHLDVLTHGLVGLASNAHPVEEES
jgi:hypothetical protein